MNSDNKTFDSLDNIYSEIYRKISFANRQSVVNWEASVDPSIRSVCLVASVPLPVLATKTTSSNADLQLQSKQQTNYEKDRITGTTYFEKTNHNWSKISRKGMLATSDKGSELVVVRIEDVVAEARNGESFQILDFNLSSSYSPPSDDNEATSAENITDSSGMSGALSVVQSCFTWNYEAFTEEIRKTRQ